MKIAISCLLLLLMAVPLAAQNPAGPPLFDFNEKDFYQCSVIACSVAAVTGFLFGPAGFAAGCTAGMLSCAAKTGLMDPSNPQEVQQFIEEFQGICYRQTNDTVEAPRTRSAFGLQ